MLRGWRRKLCFGCMWNLHHIFKSSYSLSVFFVLCKPQRLMASRFAPAVSRGSGTCRTENRSHVFSSFVTGEPPQRAPRPAVRLIGEWRFAPRQNQNEYYHTSFIQVLIEHFLSLHLSARKGTKSSSVVIKINHFPAPDILHEKHGLQTSFEVCSGYLSEKRLVYG